MLQAGVLCANKDDKTPKFESLGQSQRSVANSHPCASNDSNENSKGGFQSQRTEIVDDKQLPAKKSNFFANLLKFKPTEKDKEESSESDYLQKKEEFEEISIEMGLENNLPEKNQKVEELRQKFEEFQLAENHNEFFIKYESQELHNMLLGLSEEKKELEKCLSKINGFMRSFKNFSILKMNELKKLKHPDSENIKVFWNVIEFINKELSGDDIHKTISHLIKKKTDLDYLSTTLSTTNRGTYIKEQNMGDTFFIRTHNKNNIKGSPSPTILNAKSSQRHKDDTSYIFNNKYNQDYKVKTHVIKSIPSFNKLPNSSKIMVNKIDVTRLQGWSDSKKSYNKFNETCDFIDNVAETDRSHVKSTYPKTNVDLVKTKCNTTRSDVKIFHNEKTRVDTNTSQQNDCSPSNNTEALNFSTKKTPLHIKGVHGQPELNKGIIKNHLQNSGISISENFDHYMTKRRLTGLGPIGNSKKSLFDITERGIEKQQSNESRNIFHLNDISKKHKEAVKIIDYKKFKDDINMYEGLLYSDQKHKMKSNSVNEFTENKNYKTIIEKAMYLKRTTKKE